jgi:hypothetical protein
MHGATIKIRRTVFQFCSGLKKLSTKYKKDATVVN